MNNNTYGVNSKHNLNFEEEIMLSKKIQAGNEAKEILNGGNQLSGEERRNLNCLIEEGEAAFGQLVEANVPRAMKFAYETWLKNKFGVNDLEDYQQTALKVICTCARTFDWTKGFRFGTLAHHCLQHEMLRENAKTCYALRIPEESLMQLSTLKQNPETSVCRNSDKLIAACSPYISLQAPLGKDRSDEEFGDFLPDTRVETAEQIEDNIENENRLLRLNRALEALPDDERNILKGRMGYYGEPQTLKSFVGIAAKSVSGVQKKQIAAVKHLRELYFSLPLAG